MSEETRPTQSADESSDRVRPVLKLVAKNIALNMIPGYPLIGAVRSIKMSAGPGAEVISDLAKQLRHKRTGERVRSWSEAMAARPLDALPLRTIHRRNSQAKWIFMALAFFALCRALGYATSAQWMGVLTSALFVWVCSLQIFKYEYRLRQMETGPLDPDKPLMSSGEFLRGRGFAKHFFNPRVEWK